MACDKVTVKVNSTNILKGVYIRFGLTWPCLASYSQGLKARNLNKLMDRTCKRFWNGKLAVIKATLTRLFAYTLEERVNTFNNASVNWVECVLESGSENISKNIGVENL